MHITAPETTHNNRPDLSVEVNGVDPAHAADEGPPELPYAGGQTGREATAGAAAVGGGAPLAVRGDAPPKLGEHHRLGVCKEPTAGRQEGVRRRKTMRELNWLHVMGFRRGVVVSRTSEAVVSTTGSSVINYGDRVQNMSTALPVGYGHGVTGIQKADAIYRRETSARKLHSSRNS